MDSNTITSQEVMISHKGAKSIENALKEIFPDKQEENRLQRTRRIMGTRVEELTDHELDVYITEFQYLIDSFMDEFERKIFNNKTLKEILKEM